MAGTGPAPGPTMTPAIVPATGPLTAIDKDGTYAVGAGLVPGTYASAGPVEGTKCYWKRVAADNAIIDNALSGKPQVVTIEPTDAAFKTTGCQPWLLSDQAPPPENSPQMSQLQMRRYLDTLNCRRSEAISFRGRRSRRKRRGAEIVVLKCLAACEVARFDVGAVGQHDESRPVPDVGGADHHEGVQAHVRARTLDAIGEQKERVDRAQVLACDGDRAVGVARQRSRKLSPGVTDGGGVSTQRLMHVGTQAVDVDVQLVL
jgi:hypothetical protein